MEITCPTHHRWFRKSTADPLKYLTGKNGKKIRASIDELGTQNITWKLVPLTENFFVEFEPLYQKTLSGKENAIIHDVKAKTLGNVESKYPYFCLSIYDNDSFIGGTIFSMRENRVAYAYRAYEREWAQADVKANPALIAEYVVAQFASENALTYVSHGRDRNPYGLNSSIGLAIFKLSVGCRPLLTENCELQTIDTDKLTTDALILTIPAEGGKYINEAYLFTTRESEKKYEQVTKYPEQLLVTVHYRD